MENNTLLFGEEIEQIRFNGVLDWFINVKPIEPFWKYQPTYILVQICFIIGGLCTFIHAFQNGGRWPYLWLGTILHGIVVETICYVTPDVDNFWHSQTPVMFLGLRLPLHIILLYPCFIYQASVAVKKLNLPYWAEPFAVGATAVMIDMPYDIVSVKFVHWTWHDTDPNINDRHYWAPWNSYYFYCCFTISFTFWFHFTRYLQQPTVKKWESSGLFIELRSVVLAAILGTPGGTLFFLPIYHMLHDIFNIHSEVTFFMLYSFILVIFWSGDRTEKTNGNETSQKSNEMRSKFALVFHLIAHYSVYLYMVVFCNPEDEVSIGLHETTGPCNLTKPHRTALGMVLSKREYLCVEDFNEDYYDFSCLPSGPPQGIARWYTVCGNLFKNRAEYIAVVSTICLVATVYFYNAHFRNINNKNNYLMKQKNCENKKKNQ